MTEASKMTPTNPTTTEAWREEWAVRHAQGLHPGPFTEETARRWAAENISQDAGRKNEARGKTHLLRRLVTDWEEVE